MTSTEIAVTGSGTLALTGDQIAWTPIQQAALAHIGIAEAPVADQQVFMHVAQRTRLDPFARQIYMICRREWDSTIEAFRLKWTIQTGIDGFRLIAERHLRYAGTLDPEWCGPDGVWRDSWVDRNPPVMARVKVLRHDRQHPIALPVRFSEFAATKKDGALQGQWKSKGAHMIAKVAEAAALRKAFPQDLSGLYTDDEMDHVDNQPTRTFDHAAAAPAGAPTVGELTGAAPAAEVDDTPTEEEIVSAAEVGDVDALRVLWRRAWRNGELRARIADLVKAASPAPDEPVDAEVVDPAAGADQADEVPARLADEKQHEHMHALLNKAELSRDERLAVTSHLVGRDITTSKVLTEAEADTLIARLRAFDAVGKSAMQDQIDRWLEAYAAKAGAPS